ncbi:MAG: sigma-54 dependent transcriptional regulator, partial [Myxococcota bacterium]
MTHAEDIIEHAPSILLVDDDSAFRAIYGRLLAEEGFAIIEADDRPSARDAFAAGGFDVVLLDLMLPPDGSVSQGMEMLGEFLRQRPDAKIVVVSGAGDMRFVLEAVRQGAYDFITKPADPDVLGVVVQRAVTRARLERRVSQLQNALSHSAPGTRMIGKAPAFTRALGLAERVAPSELPVLITGEHGTGKELMARTIHEHSLRAAEPFLPINCGALTESLLESTLFGHVKGAFTGAHRDRAGLFAQADGGTLFLDEIGDMPASLQVKVLRALEYGEILPVGADRPMHVDVR